MTIQLNIRLRQAYFSSSPNHSSSFPRKSVGMSNGQWNQAASPTRSRVPRPKTVARLTAALQLPEGALAWSPVDLITWCEAHPLEAP